MTLLALKIRVFGAVCLFFSRFSMWSSVYTLDSLGARDTMFAAEEVARCNWFLAKPMGRPNPRFFQPNRWWNTGESQGGRPVLFHVARASLGFPWLLKEASQRMEPPELGNRGPLRSCRLRAEEQLRCCTAGGCEAHNQSEYQAGFGGGGKMEKRGVNLKSF